jgi:hypothetical protein
MQIHFAFFGGFLFSSTVLGDVNFGSLVLVIGLSITLFIMQGRDSDGEPCDYLFFHTLKDGHVDVW